MYYKEEKKKNIFLIAYEFYREILHLEVDQSQREFMIGMTYLTYIAFTLGH